jgi:hypothetical protein
MKMLLLYAHMYYGSSKHFSAAVANGLKQLLEGKHLYQNLTIAFPGFDIFLTGARSYLTGSISLPPENALLDCYNLIKQTEWLIKNPHGRAPYARNVTNEQEADVSIEFVPPTIKLYCSVCKNKEAYNFLHGEDLLSETRDISELGKPVDVQIFAIQYQCQACKTIPEIFIIRRQGLKISLNGRSPMEVVEIPKFIPKEQSKFFSDAIIAFNSGQVLAGNFLLRTFIEQFVRSNSSNPNAEKIDPILDEYMASLPADFNNRFPSLPDIYRKLSVDIHIATGSEDIFNNAKAGIEEHFDARRIYKLVGK